MTRYDYAGDGATEVEETGQSSVWGDRSAWVVDGTQTTTLRDERGRVTSRTTRAIRNSVADIILSSEIYSYSDPLGRSYDVTDLAQRTTHYGYSCCGLDYVTDADGATTYYLYDESLKRLIGTRRVVDVVFLAERSIITTNLLDPMGRVLATKRVGTNGTVITTVQLSYDILGRLVRQTNALGGITSYTNYTDYDTGLSYKTNTYPNGGTRIETFNRDGTLASVAGSAALGVRYDYAAEKEPESSGPYRAYTKETKVKLDRSISSEWTKTYSDGLGRAYKMLYAPRPEDTEAPSALSVYNARGQLWKEQDPDAVVTLHIFNAKAEAEYTILAMSPTISSKTYDELYAAFIDPGGIDASGLADRITRVQRSVEDEVPGVTPPLTRVDTSVWDEGLSTTTLISRSETSADGLHSWQTTYGDDGLSVVSEITNVWAANGNRYTTNVAPDGAYVVNAFHLGRLVIVARFDSARNQISSTAYSYDAHGRANGTIDVRNGSTIYTFNDADFVSTVTTPVPGTPGDRPQVTTTDYDLMLQPTMVHNPDGTTVTTEYYLTGQIMRNYGSRTYPVGYGYDYAGRMNLMTNWTSFLTGAGTRVTSWHYDGSRGWLDTKGYADNTSTAYTYTKGGRLKARSWARLGTDNNPLVTTYTYGFNDGTSGNDHDGLVGISYPNDPQGTLAVAYDYDRRGRQKTITQAGNTTHLAYNNAGQQIRESYDNGTLNAYAVTNGFDQFLRRTNLVLLQGSTRLHRNVFGYDAASRLQKVADDTTATPYSASYSYLANSPLISQIIFNRDTTEVMCTTKQFDYLNRLTLISSGLPAIGPAAFSYSYNDANQRTRRVENDSSMWRYEYDTLGQVKSAKRYWSDQLPVAAQQFEYTFDDIGNRTLTKAGGDKFGGNLRQAAYTVNNVNQYTDRGIPGALDIMGVALAGETVTVQAQDAQNNADPVYRHGEYFRKELHFNNNSGPLWEQVTIGATGEPDVTGYEFLPKNQEQFTYDEDGNLTSDGHWNYGWDAENRLIALTNNASGAPDMVIHFEYDSRSRRIQKQVWNNGDGHGTPALVHKFLYDGWNLIAELDTLASTISTYSWGLDLSGTMQGAGGVGGLLWLRQASGVPHFAAHDGNGNVAMLLSSSDGSVSARYEYGPFGELLRATGPMPKANPFRFSTKYEDEETDLLYYGYRYCSPSVGRWLLRDPIQENGAMNPYSFANNDALRGLDGLGNITVIYPRSVSGDARDITVEINATLTVSDVCHGGPLLFTVNFDVDYDNQGGGVGPGTWFSYGGTRTQATGYHESDKHMLWSVVYSKPLPVCPSGRQSGSLQFDTGEWQETMVSIILDWHYKCDCACRESEPFKPSYTYLVFPPIELPKPRPPRPGKPIRFDRKTI
jgi:RHS repeat-associated protein